MVTRVEYLGLKSARQNLWKSPGFVPFGDNLAQFGPESDSPVVDVIIFSVEKAVVNVIN